MTVNNSRSMNRDLQMGLSDGMVKTLTPDRGGEVEMAGVAERAGDLQAQYSITNNHRAFNTCTCGCC